LRQLLLTLSSALTDEAVIMSKKFDPHSPSGRIVFDARGNAVWQWRTETGEYKSEVDTQTVRALQDATVATLGAAPVSTPTQSVNHDPYSTAGASRSAEKTPRRTLDDMRKLSEEIKRAREQKKPSP
jgi:hypothetical protein